jgi:uncharacterized repeat protein (TIGR01451 family)
MRICHVLLAAAALAAGTAHAQDRSGRSGPDDDIAELPPADVSVTLTDGLQVVSAGQTVRWTLTVNNVGISGLTGVVVTTALSSNLNEISWDCRATTGSQCTSNGSGELTDSINIASRGNVSYRITATVAPDATGSVSVSVSAATPAGYVDLTPDNNRATDTDTVFDAELIFADGFDG